MIHIIGQNHRSYTPEIPDCPICKKDMGYRSGKKGMMWVCYSCKVCLSVQDPLVLAKNLWDAGTMMKKPDIVIIGQLEWEVVLVKSDRDALLRRPNPKDKKKMDFCIVEVIDFVFDKEQRKWIEVDALPEDGDGIFKSK